VIEGKNAEEDFQRCLDFAMKLYEEISQPLLYVIGVDRLLAHYGTNDTIRVLNSSATLTREFKGILSISQGWKDHKDDA